LFLCSAPHHTARQRTHRTCHPRESMQLVTHDASSGLSLIATMGFLPKRLTRSSYTCARTPRSSMPSAGRDGSPAAAATHGELASRAEPEHFRGYAPAAVAAAGSTCTAERPNLPRPSHPPLPRLQLQLASVPPPAAPRRLDSRSCAEQPWLGWRRRLRLPPQRDASSWQPAVLAPGSVVWTCTLLTQPASTHRGGWLLPWMTVAQTSYCPLICIVKGPGGRLPAPPAAGHPRCQGSACRPACAWLRRLRSSVRRRSPLGVRGKLAWPTSSLLRSVTSSSTMVSAAPLPPASPSSHCSDSPCAGAPQAKRCTSGRRRSTRSTCICACRSMLAAAPPRSADLAPGPIALLAGRPCLAAHHRPLAACMCRAARRRRALVHGTWTARSRRAGSSSA
jgi:hypothetical protein